jgi:hypothetical protein
MSDLQKNNLYRNDEYVKRLYDAKYQTQRDIMAIASIGLAGLDAEVRIHYQKVIRGKFQEFWMRIGEVLEELGEANACGCTEHSHCETCIGRRFVDIENVL